MTEAEVASIKTMVQLSHIDAPLAGLHRSFDTIILHKEGHAYFRSIDKNL